MIHDPLLVKSYGGIERYETLLRLGQFERVPRQRSIGQGILRSVVIQGTVIIYMDTVLKANTPSIIGTALLSSLTLTSVWDHITRPTRYDLGHPADQKTPDAPEAKAHNPLKKPQDHEPVLHPPSVQDLMREGTI